MPTSWPLIIYSRSVCCHGPASNDLTPFGSGCSFGQEPHRILCTRQGWPKFLDANTPRTSRGSANARRPDVCVQTIMRCNNLRGTGQWMSCYIVYSLGCLMLWITLLKKIFVADEVKSAFFDMEPSKAPGVDGFTVGEGTTTAVLSFLSGGELPLGLNDTAVTLIPKVRNP